VGSLLTFDIPQTALVATLDTYDFINKWHRSANINQKTQVSTTFFVQLAK
jgi:hypothetical protein